MDLILRLRAGSRPATLALPSPPRGRLYRLVPGQPLWVERQHGELLRATGLCRRA